MVLLSDPGADSPSPLIGTAPSTGQQQDHKQRPLLDGGMHNNCALCWPTAGPPTAPSAGQRHELQLHCPTVLPGFGSRGHGCHTDGSRFTGDGQREQDEAQVSPGDMSAVHRWLICAGCSCPSQQPLLLQQQKHPRGGHPRSVIIAHGHGHPSLTISSISEVAYRHAML